eukprot:1181307-Prorocentrum_minimum.AAC.2
MPCRVLTVSPLLLANPPPPPGESAPSSSCGPQRVRLGESPGSRPLLPPTRARHGHRRVDLTRPDD